MVDAYPSSSTVENDPINPPFDLDYASLQTSDAAFESLSALLAASQEYGGGQMQ